MKKADIGLVGLAVMGENLVLNMESKGYCVAVFNRTVQRVDDFAQARAKGKNIIPCRSIEELCNSLESPKKIMLMVKSGKPVDLFIDMLIPHLDKGDIIIDGGNSHFPDTARRVDYLEKKGILFIGTGVSGGEEGALKGPSIMPGGNPKAWESVKEIFQAISAKVADGSDCCQWVGSGAAGHFVKMVHNGIEYGDMQLICEIYQIMSKGLGMSSSEMAEIFTQWNKGVLDSYLIEISRDILNTQDPETANPMVEMILDTAGQKGTGKWTSQSGLDLGVPIPQIAEAVFARCISAIKEERVIASKILNVEPTPFTGNKNEFVQNLHDALYMSKICSYAQGYQLMAAAGQEYKWDLNFGDIALMWRGGCIIRAQFLDKIKEAFTAEPDLKNLLIYPYFANIVTTSSSALRNVIKVAIDLGIPTPSLSSALNYFDSYRSEKLPANMLQAQRDYFGAHTYERIDKPRGEFFHTNWTGTGGTTTSQTYKA